MLDMIKPTLITVAVILGTLFLFSKFAPAGAKKMFGLS